MSWSQLSVPLQPCVVRSIFSALTVQTCFLVHDFLQMMKNYSLPMTREKSKKDPQPLIQVTLKPTGIYNLVSRNSGVLSCVEVNKAKIMWSKEEIH